ncbi:MAG: hypothetical protein U0X75_09530 [Acidobacteriota bacterium]
MTETALPKKYTLAICSWLLSCIVAFFVSLQAAPAGKRVATNATRTIGDALYFSLQPISALPPAPSSLLVQSPSYVDVPAGTVLSVHLLRGDTLISTSTLSFQQSYINPTLVPPVPVASFVPLGSSTSGGQPLPNATLTAGAADLTKVAQEPGAYRLLWMLDGGVMGTPGRAIATGAPVSFVDLKLSAVSSATILGDQKPGSVLFFNRYTSSASNPARENTMINITNTSATQSTFVRLFLVSGSTCQTTELQLCLSAQQTVSYVMSDIDPGIRGYIVAVATNQQGEPVQFNWLTGNAVVKQPATNVGGTFTAVLNALAIAKRKEGVVTPVAGFSEMVFDDVVYDRLSAQVAFDGVPSQSNASNVTTVSLFRPLTNLDGGPTNANLQLTTWAKDAQNQVVSGSGNVTVACYSDVALSTLRLTPRTVAQLLPAGSFGWLAASAADSLPVFGAQLNSGEFNSGGNGRALNFSAEYKIRLPIDPVTCPQ